MARRSASYSPDVVAARTSAAKTLHSENRLADMRAAANLVKDLRAPIVPLAVARTEAMRSKALARAVAAGRITLTEARAQLRGAA